jgi:membrane-bound lytic murein transglycosylase D
MVRTCRLRHALSILAVALCVSQVAAAGPTANKPGAKSGTKAGTKTGTKAEASSSPSGKKPATSDKRGAKGSASSASSASTVTTGPGASGATPGNSREERARDEAQAALLTQAEREWFGPRTTSLAPAPAAGLPKPTPLAPPPVAEGSRDVSFLSKLEMPDLPVRLEARVVRYLEFLKEDPRGKGTLAVWARRSGRYVDAIRRSFKKKGIPEDLAWLAMVESGYDASARSPVGALGLWQFMPDTGRTYGLAQDKWLDQRLAPKLATEAAADFLIDLQKRFGSWDLAMAAYNMGSGGLLSVVRRYNTNDYWVLSELEGALPWETTLYVPKILAVAVAMKNPATFGIRDLTRDAAVEGDEVQVGPGTPLQTVALAAGVSLHDVETLNLEYRLGKVPPATSGNHFLVRVPLGSGPKVLAALPKVTGDDRLVPVVVPAESFVYPGRKRIFHRVAAGDTVRELAERYRVGIDEILKWNALDAEGRLQDGMTLQLFVQDTPDGKLSFLNEGEVHPVVVGSDEFFALTDPKGRKRVEVVAKRGDTLESIGAKHKVSPALMERINRRGRHEPLAEGTKVYLYLEQPGGGAAQAAVTPVAPARASGHEPSPAMPSTPPQAMPPSMPSLAPLPN